MADPEKTSTPDENTSEKKTEIKTPETKSETEKSKTATETKTVSVEDFEALRKAQQGSDRQVQELMKTNKELLGQIEKEKRDREDSKKTEAQKTGERIAALEKENAEAKAEAARERTRNAGIKKLASAKIPTDLEGFSPVDFLIGKDEEATLANIDAFGKYLEAYFTERVNPLLKGNGRTPHTRVDDTDKYFTVEQINVMTPDEYAKNEEKVEASLKYWYSLGKSR